MICAECKQAIAESSQSCPVCGTPVTSLARAHAMTAVMRSRAQTQQLPELPMGLPADAPGSSSPSTALPADSVGQRHAAGSSRRLAMAITSVALAAGVALVALGAVIFVISVPHSAASAHLTNRTRPVLVKPWWVSWFQLRPGDCLNSSNLGLDNYSGFPEAAIAVPCTRQHVAEVYFVGNLWPESLANYPGDTAASKTADAQCRRAFAAYDGIAISQSQLQYHYWYPAAGSDWDQPDRQVACVAYQPYSPMSSSVKGSRL